MLKIVKNESDGFEDFLKKLGDSSFSHDNNVVKTVSSIIEDVRIRGDEAIREYSLKFDNYSIPESGLLLDKSELKKAYDSCDSDLLESLETAYYRITDYHKRQFPINEKYTDDDGVTLGWKWSPVDSTGLYVPGGKAFYPSSVLMNAVPAIVAGVKRIAITVPTPDGFLNPVLLAAAKICGIDEIYRMGGAQAVAALSFGTDLVKRVDKIVGPGNAYVAEAKRQLFGSVGIDMIAGPSEILVIADDKNNARHIAADLLSQAEHDSMARSILIAENEDFVRKINKELEVLLEMISKKSAAKESLINNGVAIVVDDLLNDAPAITNVIAPEHLEIATDNPEQISKNIRNAGAIFLGRFTPEAFGDYVAGPSHVLPTSSTARFSSGLGVLDFMKRTSMIKANNISLQKVGKHAVNIAKEEGLDAHALSITVRKE